MSVFMRAYETRNAERIPDLLASQSPATPHLQKEGEKAPGFSRGMNRLLLALDEPPF